MEDNKDIKDLAKPHTTGIESTRKRKSSALHPISAQEVSANLHKYGEIILHCIVHISKSIRDAGNEVVLRYTCALLNSGGGILHMRNLDENRLVQPKDLDTWWSAMENKLADIISSDDICNYFDLIGNFDDKDLYLFVKTAEHICTLDFHSRLPTDTATHDISYQSAMKLLKKTGNPGTIADLPEIPGEFSFKQTNDTLKQESKQIQFKQLSSNSSREGKTLPSKIKFTVSRYITAFANHEGGHIYFGIEDNRAEVIGEELSEEDEQKAVELMIDRMKPVIWGNTDFLPVKGVHWDIKFYPVLNSPPRMGRRVVVVVSVCKFPGGVFTNNPESYYVSDEGHVHCWKFKQWKEAMLSSERDKPELHNRYVKLDLKVPQAPLVFALKQTLPAIKNKLLYCKRPWWLQPRHALDVIADAEVKEFIIDVLEQHREDDNLCVCVNCWGMQVFHQPPQGVYCDFITTSTTKGCHLLTFADGINDEVKQHCQKVGTFLKNRLVLHGGCSKKFGILCQVINVRRRKYIKEYHKQCSRSSQNKSTIDSSVENDSKFCRTFSNKSLSDVSLGSRSNSGISLDADEELLLDGDIDNACMVCTSTNDNDSGKSTKVHLASIKSLIHYGDEYFPSTFDLNSSKLDSVITAFIVCMAAYKPVNFSSLAEAGIEEVLDCGTYYYLLTCDQFELLWFQQFTRELWIHGPPGAGKTVAAVQFALEMRRTGCKQQEILYLAENKMLCSYVKSFNICLVATRREFLNQMSKQQTTPHAFEYVCNVIVDEAQNFKSRDGDWYSFANGLTSSSRNQKLALKKSGFFWVFMDYSQKVHKFSAGLPSSVGRNNFMLSEITRNSKEIFDYAMHFLRASQSVDYDSVDESDEEQSLKKVDSNAVLGHQYSTGHNVDVISCKKQDLVNTISRVLSDLLKEGVNIKDIAVLVGRKKDKEELTPNLRASQQTSGVESLVSMDTVKDFSGMDKSTVIGVNPSVNENHADFDKFMYSLATRAKDNLVIISSNDKQESNLKVFNNEAPSVPYNGITSNRSPKFSLGGDEHNDFNMH